MLKNLKTSEKILLAILLVAIIFTIMLILLVPKYREKGKLIEQNNSLETELNQLKTQQLIDTSPDTSKSTEEKSLDNDLLDYKDKFFIEDFSQELIILKLNDFIKTGTTYIDGFQIETVSFQQVNNLSATNTGNSTFFAPVTDPNADPNATTSTDPNADPNATTSTDPNADPNATTSTDPNADPNATNSQAMSGNAFPSIDTLKDPNLASNFIGANISFTSSYDSLVAYIKNLEQYTDAVLIKSVIINPVVASTPEMSAEDESTNGYKMLYDGYVSDVPDSYFIENSILNGDMELIFVEFPAFYDEDIERTPSVLETLKNAELSVTQNPFKPFSNFSFTPKPEEEDISSNNANSGDSSGSEYVGYNYKTLYGFEDRDYFFASSPKSVTGNVTNSTLSHTGKNSGKLTYKFIKGVETNTASLVIGNKSVAVSEPATGIGLYAYSFNDFQYDLGITVKDSSGKSYDLILEKTNSDSYLWDYYEAPLPSLSYPFIVTRVFVSTEGHEKDQLQGELLIDTIQYYTN